MKRIAVFVSGGGTDMQSIINAVKRNRIKGEIVAVIASKPGIYALKRAEKHKIPSYVFERKNYVSPEKMYEEISLVLEEKNTDLIVLAGYLGILTENIVDKYRGKIINVHPSLIPKYCGKGYYGLNVHRAVLSAGEKVTGVTVHYVDEGTDTGEIISQKVVPVKKHDTAESLQARVLEEEHKILPETVARICGGVNGRGKLKKLYKKH